MKTSRLIVAGIAGLATLGAFVLSGSKPPAVLPATVVVTQAPPPVTTVEVMTTGVDILMGQVVNEADIKWIGFPKEAVNAGYITRIAGQDVNKDVVGAIARYPFVAGEPLRREKLIQANGSGFLSAILPPGKRAVAITTEPSGASTAGGFILPNDRVDIIRVYRDEAAAKAGAGDAMRSEAVITNVRVLAIGQNIQERNGEKFITSQTATLELDPRQTEIITLAQRGGALTLALRSIQDANRVDGPSAEEPKTGLTLVRFGVSTEVGKK